tara:strand:+ start:265 stop:375 length:111 start_codon:yes stop_codon:yes gene_type:complete
MIVDMVVMAHKVNHLGSGARIEGVIIFPTDKMITSF